MSYQIEQNPSTFPRVPAAGGRKMSTRLKNQPDPAHILDSYGAFYYWRDGTDEVDFVLESDRLYAIEVKSGRKRRAAGLAAFLRHFPGAVPVILTPETYPDFDADPASFLSSL